jgi:hypothetical protein
MSERRTHVGDVKISWYEKRADRYGDGVDVIGWYRVRTGVLKGQMSKAYLGTFDSEAGAEAVYGSMNWNNKYLEPSQSLSHLPGEDDPVPGGMYPDDWT